MAPPLKKKFLAPTIKVVDEASKKAEKTESPLPPKDEAPPPPPLPPPPKDEAPLAQAAGERKKRRRKSTANEHQSHADNESQTDGRQVDQGMVFDATSSHNVETGQLRRDDHENNTLGFGNGANAETDFAAVRDKLQQAVFEAHVAAVVNANLNANQDIHDPPEAHQAHHWGSRGSPSSGTPWGAVDAQPQALNFHEQPPPASYETWQSNAGQQKKWWQTEEEWQTDWQPRAQSQKQEQWHGEEQRHVHEQWQTHADWQTKQSGYGYSKLIYQQWHPDEFQSKQDEQIVENEHVKELCNMFGIEPFIHKQLQDEMHARGDTFYEDMHRLRTDMLKSHAENGASHDANALITSKIQQMRQGTFVGLWEKPDAELMNLLQKFHIDDDFRVKVTDVMSRHPRTRRLEYYSELVCHLEASPQASALIPKLLVKIANGEGLGPVVEDSWLPLPIVERPQQDFAKDDRRPVGPVDFSGHGRMRSRERKELVRGRGKVGGFEGDRGFGSHSLRKIVKADDNYERDRAPRDRDRDRRRRRRRSSSSSSS